VEQVRSFVEAAKSYRREGGHVDWARIRLWDGDNSAPLAEAYKKLVDAVTAEREKENERFARLLAKWSDSGSIHDSITLVEQVLDGVTRPVAQAIPVLLLVIDGMSMAVYRELLEDLTPQGWIERGADDDAVRNPVIATIPSVTEVSRMSLLSGKIGHGNQRLEKEAFSSHPGLVGISKPRLAPVLFHKSDLREAGEVGVSSLLSKEIANRDRRVVGVVINAVDDHLLRGDQVRIRWSSRSIRPLQELMDAARDSERAVILVSDHGHVLERDTVSRGPGDHDRWRATGGRAEPDEVQLEGPRVVPTKGSKSLDAGRQSKMVAPWSERVHYGIRKNGYHGGVTPQEVVIPLCILASSEVEIVGYPELPLEIPHWWEEESAAGERESRPAPPVRGKGTKRGRRSRGIQPQGELFPKKDAVAFEASVEWIERLFASEAFTAQRPFARRVNLTDERIRDVLLALDERGKMTCAALARRLGLPLTRMSGMVSFLRRLLNVDGYLVLAVDDTSDSIELNRELLETQFDI